ncbi:MAG: NAD(P)H-hydrate dehydratase [Gemmatimonadota bacterium]|nr:NAD(P)H-hydrate dehydratase [Gemmatimonadota bacterium]
MTVRVVTAAEAAERDGATIASGTPSQQLMQRAGRGAAIVILEKFGAQLAKGVIIFTGPGNNGGDGWVVAEALKAAGVNVSIEEAVPPKTSDAIGAKNTAAIMLATGEKVTRPGIVIDALLGTGAAGDPRGAIADAIRRIDELREGGAMVVALDLPSGLDATNGDHNLAVRADLTVTFGTIKRGQLLARDLCGEIVVVDIGLDPPRLEDTAHELIDEAWVQSRLPAIRYDDNKGKRGKLAIVAGGPGMPGAAILAGRAALRSGIGLLKMVVHESNVPAVAGAIPSALISVWTGEASAIRAEVSDWADALVIGPGMGNTAESRSFIELILGSGKTPVLLDADALNVYAGDTRAVQWLFKDRKGIITPHPAELGRLLSVPTEDILNRRFEIGTETVLETNATTLLKGAPTIVTAHTGKKYCIARGTAALATGGSGDILSGIAGALLAQTGDPETSACIAAWVHGRAAELCGYLRGVSLDDVLFALPRAWNEREPSLDPPVLARLPMVAS